MLWKHDDITKSASGIVVRLLRCNNVVWVQISPRIHFNKDFLNPKTKRNLGLIGTV